MSLPVKFFAKKYLFAFILILLLGWSVLSQTFLASDFDRAKTGAARWPQLARPHLNLSLALFKIGSPAYQKELALAKKSLFWHEKKFAPQLSMLNQPQLIAEEINFWQAWLKKNLESPEVYLRLSVFYYQLYQDDKAKQAWQKAFYLDPNNKLAEEIGKVINKNF